VIRSAEPVKCHCTRAVDLSRTRTLPRNVTLSTYGTNVKTGPAQFATYRSTRCFVAPLAGIEPATHGLGNRCSIH
jgi:hypothetical protein